MIKIINEDYYVYHSELNPLIWDSNNQLRSDIDSKINKIVLEFLDYIGIDLNIADIRLVGSNASYNYTPTSDLDIHLVVNYELMDCSEELLQSLFNSLKSDFNKSYDISIKGVNAEIYVEDIKSSTLSNGVYSVPLHQWIKFPVKYSDREVELNPKYSDLLNDYIIPSLTSSTSSEVIKSLINKLYLIRKEGLESPEGEFSVGNLVFKKLRSEGYLTKLKDRYYELRSKELSLESYCSVIKEED